MSSFLDEPPVKAPTPPGFGFTEQQRCFPRVDRPKWQIRYPNFPEVGDAVGKLYHSGAAASSKWAAAFADGDLSKVDPTDFIVAVFDKAAELNDIILDLLLQNGRYLPGPESWVLLVDTSIDIAHHHAMTKLNARWTDAELSGHTAPITKILEFARGAMDYLWERDMSDGEEAPRRPCDISMLKRYLPDPTTLPPRPFIRMDSDLPEDVIWLDYKYDEVAAPTTAQGESSPSGSSETRPSRYSSRLGFFSSGKSSVTTPHPPASPRPLSDKSKH